MLTKQFDDVLQTLMLDGGGFALRRKPMSQSQRNLLITSVVGPALPSAASAGRGSYQGISCHPPDIDADKAV
jgi:hypothetical protein